MENDYDSRVMAADEWHISEHLRMTTRTAEEQKERLHALDQGSFIYGFCGFSGSGKNTGASFLLDYALGQSHSFAGPLKDGVAAMFGWSREMLEGNTDASRAWREQPDEYWSLAFNRSVTPRQVLQEVGTDVFRQYLPNMWVYAAVRHVKPMTTTVFTDTRFGNEKAWITSQGGSLIWVYRPEMPHLSNSTAKMVQKLVDNHETLSDKHVQAEIRRVCRLDTVHTSETSFLYDGVNQPHVVIKNTTTIDDLSLMMQHLHNLHKKIKISPDFWHEVPWNKRTLYLSMLNGEYWWEWSTTHGAPYYCVYGKDDKLIKRSLNVGT